MCVHNISRTPPPHFGFRILQKSRNDYALKSKRQVLVLEFCTSNMSLKVGSFPSFTRSSLPVFLQCLVQIAR